jgi:hypothetical protein
LQVQTAKPCARFEVTTHAGGSISHAGSALLGELAGRVAFPSTLDRDSPAGERLPCRGCWRLKRFACSGDIIAAHHKDRPQ